MYAKHWPHSNIRSFCYRSLHAFNSRYGCIYLVTPFTPKVFLHDIHHFRRGLTITATSNKLTLVAGKLQGKYPNTAVELLNLPHKHAGIQRTVYIDNTKTCKVCTG